MTKTVTQQKAALVLNEVAKFLATKGWGTPICQHGRDVDDLMRHRDDGSDCDNVKMGPAPTGHEAAMHGLGPELVMDWDWPGRPTPTILLEGGPYDWAIDASFQVKVPGVYVEPYAGYALCVFPEVA